MIKQKKKIIKITKKKFPKGIVHIKTTYNNVLVSVSDPKGNVIAWSSSGACGFKSSKKATPLATKTTTAIAVKKAIEQGLQKVEINISGPGTGRETALKCVQSLGLRISCIRDVTPLPHNGCRPSKRRRI
uniref:Small ribosomal subunit protein uS11c n=2 Tax=Euglena gracilis TaxID=3039 RepID=RR11_EUGGR|nr:ribosomal protein S11 [Euglena gracilis]P27419.1 RecName: Full=Small ribosomal subunit protein uS11c; AltName: Full=30S ribosomal protein S11, chloroplastic [Euglena gracilis]AKL82404.1 ribosomal protein S11 [Euglena gracilis var. bacillaris]AAA84229.1 ribosomal protein S11 [Euglena gracilis]CAA50135.1 30S ribosomal protein S11 [Euglena gracilis]prf//1718312B ribosomal protein S11 [Euglena gracilis]